MYLPIKLNLSLLNVLREFKTDPSAFSLTFLKETRQHLTNSEALISSELKAQTQQKLGFEADFLILAIHISFSRITNLAKFITIFKPDFQLVALSVEAINKTNLFNKASLTSALKEVNADPWDSIFLDNFTVNLLLDESTSTQGFENSMETLSIPASIVSFFVKTQGLIDIYFDCYICNELNKAVRDKNLRLYPWVLPNADLVPGFAEVGLANTKTFKTVSFSQKDLENYIEIITQALTELRPVKELFLELETLLFYSVYFQDEEIGSNLEKLFIALLGHPHYEVRNRATLFLNVLYDNTHWQFRGPLKTKIATVGDKFRIECIIESEAEDSCFALSLKSLSFEDSQREEVVSWHLPKVESYEAETGSRSVIISMDFGVFPRAGFYDWKLVKFQTGGKIASVYTGFSHAGSLSASLNKLETLESRGEFTHGTAPIQGRYIIHPQGTRDLQLHEIMADFPEGLPSEKNRGSFMRIAERIPGYARSGINALYVMGAFERNTGLGYGEDGKILLNVGSKCKESSPLAITNRTLPNTLLGGAEGLTAMIQVAKQKKVKIILDFVTRVSSAKHHKKYAPYLLYMIDSSEKKVPFYGSDGRGWFYEDTAVLNFRKKETWDLLIQETVEFIRKYDIDGIHIDNAELVPQYFDLDVGELTRREDDGERVYSADELFYGNIVLPNSESGYWATDFQQSFANPFYVKLCKTLWQHFPNLIIIGDVLDGHHLEDREENIIRSGPIPRIYKLPKALATIYGQQVNSNGAISNIEKQTVNSLRSWYEGIRKNYPSGSIVIQSTASHGTPYLSLLFRKATWSVIDLFFFLPDLPMTFLGEEAGHAFRIKTVNEFQRGNVKRENTYQYERKGITKSLSDLKKVLFGRPDDNSQKDAVIESRSLSERATLQEILNGDNQIAFESAPEYGIDLRKIKLHYEHRRKLRHTQRVLREGRFISLLAEHAEGFHPQVLSFARVCRKDATQLAIIAINFNDHNVYFHINLKHLRYILDSIDQQLDKAVVKIEDWLGTTINESYTLYEFLHGRIETSLKPYSSLVWGAAIYFNDEALYQKTIQCSIARVQAAIMKHQPITGNEIASLLYYSVRDAEGVTEFVNNFGYILNTFLTPNKISAVKIFNLIEEFRKDPSHAGKLYALCQAFKEDNERKGEQRKELKNIIQSVDQILNYNKLDSIVLVTPEIGRWSTVGGLGVMVDELSLGLASLREEVICISPYYERNRKGETGYLANDPDGIKYLFNIEVFLDRHYTLGVHHGVVKGVKHYFLHNSYVFPAAYIDGDARYTMQQIAVMGKAALELLCQIKKVPSLIVTSDWFTALVPAYVKHNHFGDIFQKTKFFHLVHNLGTDYEGRMYPQPHEGTLDFIHRLPYSLFVDPCWKDLVLNPSRCVLLCCDQWGTVSNSYKEDLLKTSPLSGVLKLFKNAFGFPNGIPKEARLDKLQKLCGNDHLTAKAALQKKYFGLEKLDDSIALFGFVGRITQQKGVHLILEAVEELIRKFKGKIQLIVGGQANSKDPYASYCAGMMGDLVKKYPNNFWAAADTFFTDGVLINAGCDFGLMPSLFEPGGIVQQEFFVASTPVIAFRTGGLKDTVKEFDPKTKKGNGFSFEAHRVSDFIMAVERAMKLYENKEDLKIIRRNAFESTIDVLDVARAWLKEFYRLCGKEFIDPDMIKGHKAKITRDWDPSKYSAKLTITRLQQETVEEQTRLKDLKYQTKYLLARGDAKKVTFNFQTSQLPRPKTVAVVGDFNDWKTAYPMHYDPLLNKWNLTLNLKPGEYK